MNIVLKKKAKPPVEVSIDVPHSKSISNRLLIIKFLAHDSSNITNLSSADDTQLLENFLQQAANKTNNTFHCKNAGTTLRFLIALLSLTDGTWTLTADKRMQTRPLLPLIDILKDLGAEIHIADGTNIFPIRINGRTLSGNKTIELRDTPTSQIISALLLISPYVKGGLTLQLPPNQVSKPYIDMTIQLVNHFGGHIVRIDNSLVCNQSQYFFNEISVEKDYSSACFFFLFVAVGKISRLRIKSLQTSCLQGDFKCVEIFSQLGVATCFDEKGAVLSYNERLVSAKQELEFDLGDYPDIFPPLAVACYLSGKLTRLTNLASLRVKESDRLENMAKELNKLGQRCVIEEDTFIIRPILADSKNKGSFGDYHRSLYVSERPLGDCKETLNKTQQTNDLCKTSFDGTISAVDKCVSSVAAPIVFDSYNDHRIAMSLSAISLVCNEIVILQSDCVEKSFPDFWRQIRPFIQ